MKFDLAGINPPYTNGTQANSPIYPDIIMRSKAKYQTWIIPSSWFHSDRHAVFRKWLFENGLYKIKINPNDTFKDVTVITCCIYLEQGYTGDIEIQLYDISYSFDYRKYGEIVIANSFELTDRIMRNKPINPYKFQPHNIRLKDHVISQSEIPGWSKIVTKVTKDNVYYGWIDIPKEHSSKVNLLTSRLQGVEAHSYLPMYEGNNQIIPHLPSDSHLTWWRLTRFAIVDSDILVCNKYRSLQCESFEEATKIRDYLRSDYVTEIFKFTRSSRTLDASQFKFIPRLEDVSNQDYAR